MWWGALLGCSGTCLPRVVTTPGLESAGEQALERASSLASSAGVCLAELRVSENAAVGGESWRAPDGWSFAFGPDDLEGTYLEAEVCRAILHERPVLAAAPDGVFAGEGRDRFEAAVQTCMLGPSGRAYLAQDARCGAEALPPERRYLDQTLFSAVRTATAPELPLVEGEGYTASQDPWLGVLPRRPAFTFQERIELVGRFDLGFWLEVETLDRTVETLAPPIPITGTGWSLAASASEIAVLARFGPNDRLIRYDRQTQTTTNVLVELPFVTSDSAMALQWADVWIASQVSQPGQGGLVRIRGDDVQPFELPPAKAPALYTAVDGLWVDPLDPTKLLVHLVHHDYRVELEVFDGRIHHGQIVRLDPANNSFEALHTWTPGDPLAPERVPLGIDREGRMFFTIRGAFAGGRDLIGALDLADGSFRVSGDACIDPRWTGMVLDGAVVEKRFERDQEIWIPWRVSE